jgi:transposase
MAGKRKRYSAAFKAPEAIRGELTVAQLAAKHGIRQTMINGWKKQATEGLTMLFAGKTDVSGHRELLRP